MPASQAGKQRAAARVWGVLRRRFVAIPLLALIAIVPWLIPWSGSDDDAAAPVTDPSAIIASIKQEGPNDDDVRNVRRAMAAAQAYDSPVTPQEAAGLSTKPGPYQKLGRLRIPKIGLDVDYGEGVFPKTLVKGPGHWPGTPMPGRAGNSVISGHRNTYTQPFKELDELRPGDQIIIGLGNDQPVTYRVTRTTIVPQAQYRNFVLAQPSAEGAREITLFACHPEGNPIYRIVVQAVATG